MTSKEQASALIDKYCELLKFDYPINASMHLCARRCAIICVEQMIKTFENANEDSECTTIHIIHYWQEVLEYLKK